MSILIAVVLLGFAAVMWYQHKKGSFDGQSGWFISTVLYGVRHHTNTNFCILLGVLVFVKLWFLALAVVVLWWVYAAIRKSQSEKDKGVGL